MSKSWRLGSLLGFPIDVSVSFFLLLGLVFLAFGGTVGVAITLMAFGSIVLHELGHALVARSVGVRTHRIELGFFGGAAQLESMPRTPRHELAIAAAGPAVSLAIGGAGLGLAAVAHFPLFALIGWINLAIAAFNLIPALPMDGGRILRAALVPALGYVRATDTAVTVSRVAAVAFGVIGLSYGMYQLALLAPFLWMMGTREKQIARIQQPHELPRRVVVYWDNRA